MRTALACAHAHARAHVHAPAGLICMCMGMSMSQEHARRHTVKGRDGRTSHPTAPIAAPLPMTIWYSMSHWTIVRGRRMRLSGKGRVKP